jgi:hypothetical protein
MRSVICLRTRKFYFLGEPYKHACILVADRGSFGMGDWSGPQSLRLRRDGRIQSRLPARTETQAPRKVGRSRRGVSYGSRRQASRLIPHCKLAVRALRIDTTSVRLRRSEAQPVVR